MILSTNVQKPENDLCTNRDTGARNTVLNLDSGFDSHKDRSSR